MNRSLNMPLVIPASMAWNIVIILGSIYAALTVFQLDDFYNLGTPVQYFVSGATLIPAALAIFSTIALPQRRRAGRYTALILNYVGMVLGIGYLLHLWDVFIGIDAASAAVLDNAGWLGGLIVAYLIFWLAGRFPEESDIRVYIERAGLGLGMLALVGLLWFSDILGAASHIISQYGQPETWAVTAAVVFFGLIAYFLLHTGAYFGETTDQREAWQGWLMLSPNIIGFALFFAGPLLLSFYLSFTDAKVGQVPRFTNIKNYANILALEFKTLDEGERAQDILSFGYNELDRFSFGEAIVVIGAKDTLFWISLRNTIVFCAMLVPLSVVPALGLAIILNSKIPGMKFFRAVYFLPSVAAVVGTALIWRWLYDPTIGYFNYAISQIITFLNGTFGFNIADPKLEWYANSSTVLLSVVLLAAWQVVGFNTVLFLAGLQGVPNILYEAAYVDGASRWQQFRNVTLPMLAPTTFFVIVTTVITGLQVFNEIYALLPSRPVPQEAHTIVYYLYIRGFFRFEFGYASALAWILFALIFTITLLQFRISRSTAYED